MAWHDLNSEHLVEELAETSKSLPVDSALSDGAKKRSSEH